MMDVPMKKGRKPRPAGRKGSPRSLASSDAFEAFVLDQLEGIGDLVSRKMFGGVGLYASGYFFGIIARDVLYLKVDAENLREFEDAGSRMFKPYPNRPGTMKYYEVPVGVLESAPDLVRWARESIRAAERASGLPSSRGRESGD
jgi:DNA transformation protein and related proteins